MRRVRGVGVEGGSAGLIVWKVLQMGAEFDKCW